MNPMTPSDCRLHDFHYMPILIARLFGSEFHARANDSEWRAGVTLWLKSWHQSPAASLPDDDLLLARLAEFGRDVDSWMKVKEMALYGWVKADDGRLYHPVISELAMDAWEQKTKRKNRTADARAALEEKRRKEREEGEEGRTVTVTDSVTDSVTDKAKKKTAYGELEKVRLTDEEYAKLLEQQGEQRLLAGIDVLDAYIASKGKRYQNHYAVLKKTSWVWQRVDEMRGSSAPPQRRRMSPEQQFDAALNQIVLDGDKIPPSEREEWLEALWDKYKDVPKAYAGKDKKAVHVVNEVRKRLRKKWGGQE